MNHVTIEACDLFGFYVVTRFPNRRVRSVRWRWSLKSARVLGKRMITHAHFERL